MPWFRATPSFEDQVLPEIETLQRVARRLTGNADEAEDIVQQTLYLAFRAWPKFDGQYLRSWLIRILRNEFLRTRRGKAPKEETLEMIEETASVEPFWDTVLWNDQVHRLVTELNSLPDHYRLAIHLCDVEQMSYEEAAVALEVPVGTVRSRLFRGRVLLRNRLTRTTPMPATGRAQ